MSDGNEQHPRTVFVRVIAGLIIVFVLGTNLYLLLHLAGIGVETELASRLDAMTAVDYARRAIFGALELAAAVSLPLLRKLAVHLFLGLLVLFVTFTLYSAVTGSLVDRDLLIVAIGGLIAFGLPFWYSLRLKNEGTLR